MRTFHYFKSGTVTKSNKDSTQYDVETGGGWQFERMVKKLLSYLNVTFYDKCCDTAKTVKPVQFNEATNMFEAFNGTDWVSKSNITTSRTASAIDVTATATAAEVKTGLITSTSAAAVSITLPTATQLATALGATRGTVFNLTLDNGVGANTVTLIAGSGTTASSAVTGGTTLTVASGTVGQFLIYFQSSTTAKISRIA